MTRQELTMFPLHDSVAVRVIGAASACGIAWSSLLGYAQGILGITAAIAATVYSVYMSYDLYDRRRKRSE